MRANARCEGVTAAGKQCKCYATQTINGIPYCDQHAAKVTGEEIAMEDDTKEVR